MLNKKKIACASLLSLGVLAGSSFVGSSPASAASLEELEKQFGSNTNLESGISQKGSQKTSNIIQDLLKKQVENLEFIEKDDKWMINMLAHMEKNKKITKQATNLVKEFNKEYSHFMADQLPTLISKLKMTDVTFSKAYKQSDIINTFKNLKENATTTENKELVQKSLDKALNLKKNMINYAKAIKTLENKQEIMDHYKVWNNTYEQRYNYYNSSSNEQQNKQEYKLKLDMSNEILKILSQSR